MESQPKVNNEITSQQILLIDDQGDNLGIMSREQGLYLAIGKNLDLVQINNQFPPVCRIIDFGKYQYQKVRQQRKQKNQANKGGETKELRLRLSIQPHDLGCKLKRARKFLEDGHKLKIALILRGRELAFINRAITKVSEIKEQLPVDFFSPPKRLGNRIEATFILNKSAVKKDEIKND